MYFNSTTARSILRRPLVLIIFVAATACGSMYAEGPVVAAGTYSLRGTYTNPGGATTSDEFGQETAFLGDNFFVRSKAGDSGNGAVLLIDRDTGSLVQMYSNAGIGSSADEYVSTDDFGANIVSSTDGSSVLISAAARPTGGAVYLFNVGHGGLETLVTSPDPQSGAAFGGGICWLPGVDRLVVTESLWDDDADADVGQAHLFESDGTYDFTISNPYPDANDKFANRPGPAGDHLLVGAGNGDEGVTDAGAAYLIDPSDGSILENFIDSAGTAGDAFGLRIPKTGLYGTNKAVLGAYNYDGGLGRIYVYEFDGDPETDPVPLYDPIDHPAGSGARFTEDIQVNSRYIFAGSPGDDTMGTDAGAVYVFSLADGSLVDTLYGSTAGAQFGYRLSASEKGVLISAPFDEVSGTSAAGSVFLYAEDNVFYWEDGAGNWTDVTHWWPSGGPPSAVDTAYITDVPGTAYTVTLDTNPSLASFTMDSSDAVLHATSSYNTVSVQGDLTLQTGSVTGNPTFQVTGTSSVTVGSGYAAGDDFSLVFGPGAFVDLTLGSGELAAGRPLTLQSGVTSHTRVDLTVTSDFVNHDTISLESSGNFVVFEVEDGAGGVGTLTNEGTIDANAGAYLHELFFELDNATTGAVNIHQSAHLGNTGFTGGEEHENAGTITLGGATLQLYGDSFHNASGGVITGTGTLDASRLASGAIDDDGYIAPGLSVGSLAITGEWTQSSSGTFLFEADNDTDGEYDQLVVSGDITAAGYLKFSVTGETSYTPSAGDEFVVATSASGGVATSMTALTGLSDLAGEVTAASGELKLTLVSTALASFTGSGKATFAPNYTPTPPTGPNVTMIVDFDTTETGPRSFDVTAGNRVVLHQLNVTGGESAASVNVAPGAEFVLGNDLTLNGNVPFAIDQGTLVIGGDLTAVGSGEQESADMTITDGHVHVFGDFILGANSSLELNSASPGALSIEGDYTQTAAGELRIEIGGTTPSDEFDVLKISGAATLDGLLSVELTDTSGGGLFAPNSGDTFQILTAAGGRAGTTFASHALPALAGGLYLDVLYDDPNAVALAVYGVLGDYNLNGEVDAADYVVWRRTLGHIGAGLAADGTGPSGTPDGVVDQLDYQYWIAHFGETVGSGAARGAADPASDPVPEPASELLLILGVTFGVYRRRRVAP